MALFSKRKKTDHAEPDSEQRPPADAAQAEARSRRGAGRHERRGCRGIRRHLCVVVSRTRCADSAGRGRRSTRAAPMRAATTSCRQRAPRLRRRPRRSRVCATTSSCARRSPPCLRRRRRPTSSRSRASSCRGTCSCGSRATRARCLSEGKDLPLGVVTINGKDFVLAYSSGTALRQSLKADGETDTSAMGQPVLAVLRHVLAGPYAGLVLDHASAPARAVLPRELLEKLVDQGDETLELKTLLSGERTDATASAVAAVLTRVKFWVAVNKSADGPIRRRRSAHRRRCAADRAVLPPARGGLAPPRRSGGADDGGSARRRPARRRRTRRV